VVGQPPPLLRLPGSGQGTESADLVFGPATPFPMQSFEQGEVVGGLVGHEVGGLVEHFVGGREVHGGAPNERRAWVTRPGTTVVRRCGEGSVADRWRGPVRTSATAPTSAAAARSGSWSTNSPVSMP